MSDMEIRRGYGARMIRTKGSLCSGTGALDLATPGRLQWVSELDEDASVVLKREHPDAPNLGDLIAYPWSEFEHVDLLTSGDPCQSMSVAGRRLGEADPRFLWPHVFSVIERVKPEEIFLENVQNIVSMNGGAILARRLTDLRSAGYATRWTVLGACAVGAPHHRHRWFLRASHVGAGAPGAVRIMNKCGAPRSGGRALLPTPTTRDHKGRNQRNDATCLPGAVALLPTPNARDGGERGTPSVEHALRRVANPERSVNLEDAVIAYMLQNWGKFADAIALWEDITGRAAPAPTVPAPRGGQRLNPELSEWMMGLRPGHVTDGMARNAALKLAGNGVVPLQAAAAWDMLG